MSRPAVRPYRADDLEVIVDIGNRAWQPIYAMFRATYGDSLFALAVPDPATVKGEQVRAHALAHPNWIVVAEENGAVIGFVTFIVDRAGKAGVIGNNAVDPRCLSRGIGQLMYRDVLDRFIAEGLRYARVLTGLDEAHAPARRAYERAGFNIRHEEVTYFMELPS